MNCVKKGWNPFQLSHPPLPLPSWRDHAQAICESHTRYDTRKAESRCCPNWIWGAKFYTGVQMIARRMWKSASSAILILPTDSNWPWGENSCDTNICQLEFEINSPVLKSWYTAWCIVFRRIHWSNYYTIYTFMMLKSELNDPINSHPKWSGSRITLIWVPGS